MAAEDPQSDRVDAIIAAWRRERPDLDPSPQAVIGRLHRVALLLTRRLESVYDRFDLSEPEFDILASLRRAGAPYARRAGELAEHTMVTSGGLTKRIDRLSARGLVSRGAAPGDARAREIALTPRGRALIDRAFAAHLENERDLLDTLSGDDRRALETSLTAWLRLLEDG